MTRIFRPLKSSRRAIGPLLLVVLRKPRSQKASPMMSFWASLREQELPEGTVDEGVSVVDGRERERQVEQPELRHDAHERCRSGREHLLHASAQRGLLLHFVAELRVAVLADLQLAAAFLVQNLREFRDAEGVGIAGLHEMPPPDDALLDVLRSNAWGECKCHAAGCECCHERTTLHDSSYGAGCWTIAGMSTLAVRDAGRSCCTDAFRRGAARARNPRKASRA